MNKNIVLVCVIVIVSICVGYALVKWFIKYMTAKITGEIKRFFKLTSDHISKYKTKYFSDNKLFFVMGKRKGCYLSDWSGTHKAINFYTNGGVFNFGHRNPEIIKELNRAFKTYDIGSSQLLSAPRAELAQVLGTIVPELSNVIFGVSGGEAMDVAVKLALGYTKRRKVVVCKGSFHGNTGLSVLLGDKKYMSPFNLSSDMHSNFEIVRVEFNNLEEITEVIDDSVAACIFETIPATLGIVVPDKDYFRGVRAACDKFGVQIILDEVQNACMRTGKFFAFEHFGFVPDVVVIGKGLSGGIYPITATIFREHFVDLFEGHPFAHNSTFGGAEVGCQVALKALEMMQSEKLKKNIKFLTTFFRDEMNRIRKKYPKYFIKYRQLGLFTGMETCDVEFGEQLAINCLKNKLLLIFSNNDKRIVQWIPPLNTPKSVAKKAIRILEKAFKLTVEWRESGKKND